MLLQRERFVKCNFSSFFDYLFADRLFKGDLGSGVCLVARLGFAARLAIAFCEEVVDRAFLYVFFVFCV